MNAQSAKKPSTLNLNSTQSQMKMKKKETIKSMPSQIGLKMHQIGPSRTKITLTSTRFRS